MLFLTGKKERFIRFLNTAVSLNFI